ncbi:uncharacterized protein Dvir_GJ25822 [Drosophila virilis]|uniref:Uncharacterized protein n=1 Tax=Drosophila virilis TaxID=7244 RepID=A0A0Q9WA89_DROVI|nr:uncharacterized protein Dvir_GJ25822 [Drosophila virilis]
MYACVHCKALRAQAESTKCKYSLDAPLKAWSGHMRSYQSQSSQSSSGNSWSLNVTLKVKRPPWHSVGLLIGVRAQQHPPPPSTAASK